MNKNINTWLLNQTKKKLSIIFVVIVFLIAFFLELFYFSYKYVKINTIELNDFDIAIEWFMQDFESNPMFLMKYSQSFRKMNEKRWFWSRWTRLLDYAIFDKNGNVDIFNIWYDFSLEDFENDKISWFLFKTIYLKWDYSKVVFLRKQAYPLELYLSDITIFFLFNFIFWIWIYFIWYWFVEKNLKPVEQTMSDMSDFIQNASHELKTPLSVISSNLQIIKKMKSFDEEMLSNSIDEIKKIDWLILWLIDLSTINEYTQKDEVDIWSVINQIIWEYKYLCEKKWISVNFEEKNIKIIQANKHYFYIMFSNLFLNAIKYNFKGWKIDIVLDKTFLSIWNTWDLIHEDKAEEIFKRFYKLDESRNTQWFWIWLSLVKKIVDIYKWKIFVTNDWENNFFKIIF